MRQLYFITNFGAGSLSTSQSLGGGEIKELTGNTSLPPASGVATLTAENDVFVLSVDGVEYRRWQITWGSNFGPLPSSYAQAEFGVGGSDIHAGKTVSDVKISEIAVEVWK